MFESDIYSLALCGAVGVALVAKARNTNTINGLREAPDRWGCPRSSERTPRPG